MIHVTRINPSIDLATTYTDLARRHEAMPDLVKVLLSLDFFLALCYVASRQLRDLIAPAAWFFDFAANRNLPTWYSSLQLSLLGALLLTFVLRAPRVKSTLAPWAITGLGFGFLLLSLDQFVGLHWHVANWIEHSISPESRAEVYDYSAMWLPIGAPLFVLCIAVAGWAARVYMEHRTHIVWLFVTGLGIYVFSLVGVEAAANMLSLHGGTKQLATVVKQLGQMLGVSVMIWSTLNLLKSHGIRLVCRDAIPRGADENAD